MVSNSARPLARPLAAAFTLIELLTVVAIIGILAAITFGVAKGVNERAAINQARSELSAIATALESYKRAYGDYPQVGTGSWTGLSSGQTRLLQALIGKRGPKGAELDPAGKSFLDISRLSLSSTNDPFNSANQDSVKLVDPWGRDYFFLYKSSGWLAPTYVLLSTGPNGYAFGTTATPSTGNLLNSDGSLKASAANDSGAADNIYVN